MADKLIFIPNNDAQNFPLLYLDYNQWLKYFKYYQPIKIQLKFPNLLSQRMRKHYNKTIGTSVINSPMSPPPSLQFHISRTEFFTTALIYLFQDVDSTKHYKGGKDPAPNLGADQLQQMFPTPPSHEHPNLHSPADNCTDLADNQYSGNLQVATFIGQDTTLVFRL